MGIKYQKIYQNRLNTSKNPSDCALNPLRTFKNNGRQDKKCREISQNWNENCRNRMPKNIPQKQTRSMNIKAQFKPDNI